MTGWYGAFFYALLGKLTSLSLNKVNNKSQGPVSRKMVNFNPRLSKISSNFLQRELTNTVELLLRDKVMITQKVTRSNTEEGKIQKCIKIVILD